MWRDLKDLPKLHPYSEDYNVYNSYFRKIMKWPCFMHMYMLFDWRLDTSGIVIE